VKPGDSGYKPGYSGFGTLGGNSGYKPGYSGLGTLWGKLRV